MIEVQGKYNTAKIFTDNVDETALSQIKELCDQEFAKGSTIRIMPDTHAGAGCTVGTTMTITDKAVPNIVGVDIGCGMEVAIIDKHKDEINFDQLDEVIRKHIPHGFGVRSKSRRHPYVEKVDLRKVRAPFNEERALDSIGTLGGGNHFIELNELDDKTALVIHSGSRHLGKQIAEHYQKRAYDELMEMAHEKPNIKKELAYVQGQAFEDYLNDMKIAQEYAKWNRKAMVDEIVSRMGFVVEDSFTTIHNYIDIENMIVRKGAISAQKGERVIIPMNMRDGSIIAYGKGNPDWNYSGPHGAGRIMSRSKAKKTLNVEQFKQAMEKVWSTSVNVKTLDEAPMVYKPMNEIIEHIQEAVEIHKILKPVYNFKAD